MRRWGAVLAAATLLALTTPFSLGAGASIPDDRSVDDRAAMGPTVSDAGTPVRVPSDALPSTTSSLPFANPDWKPGYQWKYHAKMNMQGLVLDGNLTTDAVAYSNVTFGNQTYQSLKLTNTGGGTATGNVSGLPFSGPWTVTGTTHVARNMTDELQVEQTVVLDNTAPPFPATITIYSISNYTPALMNLKWPLDQTSAWTHIGQEFRYNWTLLVSPLGTQYLEAPSSSTTNLSQNYKATGPVYTVVPAGTFLALKVGNGSEFRTAPGADPRARPSTEPFRGISRVSSVASAQPFPGLADQYYSDAAGNSVQFELKDNATTTGWVNLTSTNYPPPPAKYGSQGGVVKDIAMNPLSGAKVIAATAGGPSATTSTDVAGRFAFSNLQPGQFTVTANLSGFVDAQKGAAVAIGANPDIEIILLRPTGTLEITTMDETGAVLGDAGIHIVGQGLDLTNKTDGAGKLTLVVGVGIYNVTGSKDGYKPATTSATVMLQQASKVEFRLVKIRGSISGRVTDFAKAFGIVGATITVSQASSVVKETTTDSKGEFKVALLDPGLYDVTAAAAGYKTHTFYNVSVKEGKDKNQDFILQAPAVPPVDGPGGNSLLIYAGIAGAVITALLVVALLMMRAKKKKQEAAAKKAAAAGSQQW